MGCVPPHTFMICSRLWCLPIGRGSSLGDRIGRISTTGRQTSCSRFFLFAVLLGGVYKQFRFILNICCQDWKFHGEDMFCAQGPFLDWRINPGYRLDLGSRSAYSGSWGTGDLNLMRCPRLSYRANKSDLLVENGVRDRRCIPVRDIIGVLIL